AHSGRAAHAARAAEVLEDRTLLSVTSLFFNGDLTIISDDADAIVVREDPLQSGRVEILVGNSVGGTVTYTPDTSIGVLDATAVETILVRGGDGRNDIDLGDRLGMGGVSSTVFSNLTSVTIEGRNGNDTITGTIDFGDVIDGGHGEDLITVGTSGVTVDGGDGNDTVVGSPAADVINGGDGNDSIDAGDGADTVDAGNGHDIVNGGDETTGLGDRITGGHGHDTLHGGDGDDWINGKSGHDEVYGGAGQDMLHGGSGRDLMHGGDNDDVINGHGYDDTIFGNGGADRINGHWGHDLLDGDDGDPATDGGNDKILGGSGRDTLLGNFGDDTLKGNGGNDTLIGGNGLDSLDGGSGHDLLRGYQDQIVYLDFDSETQRSDEHVYTFTERSEIQLRLEAIYSGFDVRFTQSVPETDELYMQSGAFVTITFNDPPTGDGVALGGAAEASEFDFRNINLGGTVRVDVLGDNGLLGDTGQPAKTTDNIISASAYAAAHELGHLLGLRHVDSFGPLNGSTGITFPPGATSFSPDFPGPGNADETADHVMAAPSLLGNGQFDVTGSKFLSERSTIKLAFSESGLFLREQVGVHDTLTLSGSQMLDLRTLSVPNTLESGANAGQDLNIEAAAVTSASIETGGEVDVYAFEGEGGQVVSIEVFSEWLDRLDDPIDTIVRVFDSSGTIVPYFSSNSSATDIAVSDGFDDGSGGAVNDPVLINLVLPITGNASDTYFIQVSEPSVRGLFVLPSNKPNSFTQLDPVTGVELVETPLPPGESSAGLGALAYDGTNDVVFYMNGTRDVLYELDPDTGAILDEDPISSATMINIPGPGDYDGLAVLNGLVYILDVTADSVPGQAEDQNADPPIPQILDAPEILVFDPVTDMVVDYLNLTGTGEGTKPAANPPGTFSEITGGLAAIDPGGNSSLLVVDQSGDTVHEIDPVTGTATASFSPGGSVGTYDGVGAFGGRVFLGTGLSSSGITFFNNPPITTSADSVGATAAGDLDGDGDVDVLSGSGGDDTIAWYENDGSQNFTERIVSTGLDQPQSVSMADVDNDGDMDIVFASRTGGTKVGWFENNGNEVFTLNSVDATLDDVWDVIAADLDGDGDIDLLSASSADDKVSWFENDGSQSFTLHTITSGADGVKSVFAIDVDSDGDMDVLSASTDDDTVAWYENDGSESFTAHTITSSAMRAKTVFALDMDGDGDVDVLSASEADDTIAWYENNGSENFTEFTISTAADDAESVYAADLDGDGDIDVLSASDGDDKVAWYENNGVQVFTPQTISFADGAYDVVAADVDSDGYIDVVSASTADDTVAWYQNSGPASDGRIDFYDRGANPVVETFLLSPNPLPIYNIAAIGNNDDIPTPSDTGSYELFITKFDPVAATTLSLTGDTLVGRSGDDTLYGGSSNDLLKGNSGNDRLYGLGGSDLLNASSGNDSLFGGLDDDELKGGSGMDKLFGDAGDDTLDGQGGKDTLDGSAGDDVLKWRVGAGSDVMNNSDGSARVEITGSADADTLSVSRTTGHRPKLSVSDGVSNVRIAKTIGRTDINAGDGNDTLLVGLLEDVSATLLTVNGEDGDDVLSADGVRIDNVRLRLDGGDGADTLTGSRDADTLWGGSGDDRVDGGRGDDTIVGGEGDDDIDGQDGDDVIVGNDGNDTLDGGEGHDSLSGNAGFDSLTGGAGRDTLSGGDDDDALSGSQHDDSLLGDAGQDSLYGGSGNDYLHGGLNDDRLYGNVGNDTIGGGHGHDLLEGAEGDDILNGGDGDDTLLGEEGFDGLSGHDGNDDINGGGDDDTILGGDGHDALAGGGGRDIVLGGDGNDTIDGQGGSDTLAGNEGADAITG
ncbi:MAG TPA: hypothetical protein DCE39_17405, partial [Planctomycetaceae bacterium]|nr:hypothetical protein [Planctomycetaceae bacterium]